MPKAKAIAAKPPTLLATGHMGPDYIIRMGRLYKQVCTDCGHRWNQHDKDGCRGVGKDGLKCIGCGGFRKRAPINLKPIDT